MSDLGRHPDSIFSRRLKNKLMVYIVLLNCNWRELISVEQAHNWHISSMGIAAYNLLLLNSDLKIHAQGSGATFKGVVSFELSQLLT